jgi:hypothetical protein
MHKFDRHRGRLGPARLHILPVAARMHQSPTVVVEGDALSASHLTGATIDHGGTSVRSVAKIAA